MVLGSRRKTTSFELTGDGEDELQRDMENMRRRSSRRIA